MPSAVEPAEAAVDEVPDLPSLLVEANAARTAGRLDEAEALYRRRCAHAPGDLACALAEDTRALAEAVASCEGGVGTACRAACAATLAEASCARAEPVLAAACEGGDGRACAVLAEVRGAGGLDDDAVNVLLWRACDEVARVDALACRRLADRVAAGLGALPSAARGDVAWLRNQGCDLQLDWACAHP